MNYGQKNSFELSTQQRDMFEALLREEGLTTSLPSLITPRAIVSPAHLSHAQLRLWFLHQLESELPIYTIAEMLYLSGPLSVQDLMTALNELSLRHEILRTIYPLISESPQQVIVAKPHFDFLLIDLEHLSSTVSRTTQEHLTHLEAHRPFDLATGPLMRIRVLRLTAQEHIVLFTLHHILSDYWSQTIFFRELAFLYQRARHGHTEVLPPLPIQYADYAVWQRQWLTEKLLDDLLAYWRQQLAGAPTVLNLPTDKPRPPLQTFRSASHQFGLPKPLSEALQKYCLQEGITLFMALLAGFLILLSRYSGQNDVIVGSPVANRTRAETEGLIGFFVNMLALRATISEHLSFRQFTQQVREICLDAYAHQELPFERLIEEIQPERSLSHNPLVQVTFQFLERSYQGLLPFSDLQARRKEVDLDTLQADLSLDMVEEQGKIIGLAVYNTALFVRETIQRMMDHFVQLLADFVADPEKPIFTVPLSIPQKNERKQELWQPPHIQHCVHELFELQTQQFPDAIAVVFQEQHLSYTYLNGHANQLARILRKQGVEAGARVGVCLQRSPLAIIGMLAALKAGGIYIPLDYTYPAQRLAFMLQDSDVMVVLTQERFMLPVSASTQVIHVDTRWQDIVQEPEENIGHTVEADALAYFIYTSGSTGLPKAVMVEHQSLCAVLAVSQQCLQFNGHDTMPWLSSAAFDISLFEIFMPLLSGGKVIVLSEEERLDFAQTATTLEDCTLLHAVPSFMSQLVSSLTSTAMDQDNYKHLRKVFVGGDAVPAHLLVEMQSVFPQAEIHIFYGPTETAIICSQYKVVGDQARDTHVLGTPFPNVTFRVYNQQMHIVPIGVPGELYISGIAVSRGYWKRHDLTREKFVTLDGQRWYKTGDVVRCNTMGIFQFMGRIDQQVKLRGFRIELGEIEAALVRHNSIKEAVVLLSENTATGKQLVAYITIDQGKTVHPWDLRTFLAESLPDYMLPSTFVQLASFPLTPTSKIDRQALGVLPIPDPGREKYEEPCTLLEETIARIWTEILGQTQIGIHDNFFALGGHSLVATQIITRINKLFGLQVALRTFFAGPTIADLAAVVTQLHNQQREPSLSGDMQEMDMLALLEQFDQMSESEIEKALSDLTQQE